MFPLESEKQLFRLDFNSKFTQSITHSKKEFPVVTVFNRPKTCFFEHNMEPNRSFLLLFWEKVETYTASFCVQL